MQALGYDFDRMARTWDALVCPDDLVLIPGDISCADTARRARWDLEWLAARPGQKVVGRGEQDRWWDCWNGVPPAGVKLVSSGLNEFNGLSVITLPGSPVPESREWRQDVEEEYLDQAAVLKSLLQQAAGNRSAPIVAMHYPPMARNARSRFSDLLEEYRVPLCLYGHLHGRDGELGPVWKVRGVRYCLVSADNTVFAPMPLEI